MIANPLTGSRSDPCQRLLEQRLGRLQDLQAGLARLKSLNQPRQQARSAAASKIASLRQRLQMLRAMLQGASPADAKAIARQLKALASELASLARGLGGGSSSNDTAAAAGSDGEAATPPEGAQDEGGSVAAADPDSTPSAAPASSDDSASTPATGTTAATAEAKPGVSENTGRQTDDDLRAQLRDLRLLLRDIVNRLKARLAGDKGADDALGEIERRLGELDATLGEGADNGLYAADGGFSMALADIAGGGISVSA